MPIRPENRDRYPENWRAISAQIRIDRAGNRCECEGECGRGTHDGRCPNVQGGSAYGTGSIVVLTTAHLDHTPENCALENLRAMCQGCHLHYDRKHHAESRRRTIEQRTGQQNFLAPHDFGSTPKRTTSIAGSEHSRLDGDSKQQMPDSALTGQPEGRSQKGVLDGQIAARGWDQFTSFAMTRAEARP